MLEARYSPWAGSTDMFTAMARYQAFYGLKPVGPHRPLADGILRDVTCTCDACGGTGLAGTHGGLGWRLCPECHGFGGVYAISREELEARRRRVLARYPDAAPRDWQPRTPMLRPALDLESGEIVDLDEASASAPEQLELAF